MENDVWLAAVELIVGKLKERGLVFDDTLRRDNCEKIVYIFNTNVYLVFDYILYEWLVYCDYDYSNGIFDIADPNFDMMADVLLEQIDEINQMQRRLMTVME